jgi:hypothetical protein
MAEIQQEKPEEGNKDRHIEELLEGLQSEDEQEVRLTFSELMQSSDVRLLAMAVQSYIQVYQDTEDGDLEALDAAEDLLKRIIEVTQWQKELQGNK